MLPVIYLFLYLKKANTIGEQFPIPRLLTAERNSRVPIWYGLQAALSSALPISISGYFILKQPVFVGFNAQGIFDFPEI
ncbi:hypothetical protein [Phormidium sp. CCY1219]|uniref:hypothetical protein n=1 Tax=Phormidium sp. CCY1219 TaxID=2886104 RepID=UPI002D1E4FE6|nr:hypothetical protein [Phormidium sp. CCY1219]MEB3827836.1 hypothetical protein [Phormidium sp. CCY1219]